MLSNFIRMQLRRKKFHDKDRVTFWKNEIYIEIRKCQKEKIDYECHVNSNKRDTLLQSKTTREGKIGK